MVIVLLMYQLYVELEFGHFSVPCNEWQTVFSQQFLTLFITVMATQGAATYILTMNKLQVCEVKKQLAQRPCPLAQLV